MRKLLFGLAVIFAGTVQAQEVMNLTKQMRCSNAEFIMSEFTQKWGEVPVWVANTSTGTHVTLLINKEKKTWTMIEYDARIACILNVGEGGSDPNVF